MEKGYIAMVFMCKEKTEKAKAQLELKLASVFSQNKKGIFKYVDNNRRSKGNIELIPLKMVIQLIVMKKKPRHSMWFLPQPLITLTDLGLPSQLTWRTMTVGTGTFYSQTLKLQETSCVS